MEDRAASQAVERVTALARRRLEIAALRLELLDVLGALLDFDAHVWLLTDPRTCVGAAPLADIPGLPLDRLASLIRAKYTSRVNRWTQLAEASAHVALLDLQALPSHTDEPWPAAVREQAYGAVASTVFADPFGCWSFLDLWRRSVPFTEEDAGRLASVAPAITRALREAQARTFDAPPTSSRQGRGPAVVTLDGGMRIRGATAESQAWLDVLLPPVPDAHAIPASVFNVAAQLLAVEAGVDAHEPVARAHLGDGVWVTLRAARTVVAEEGASREGVDVIVVTIEESNAADRLDLVARAYALTPRETEVLGRLAAGDDTRSLARGLGLSEHTVQDHVKSIFAKTAAHDRIALLARAIGTAVPRD